MNNADVLAALLTDLRAQLVAINSSPIVPHSVKLAVDTTFQVLEILSCEALKNGKA